ncbi:site-specific integrase [Tropicibacter oceani]|uniref:Integrase n=1 Tax=Tropicibacter oceani TaxID=3058420 RepID=A0ABY8QDR4_9RHOB|nr:hypothetical protein [Tropicibacter oceani]WGW02765.1 hypothetical protein QF118_12555 [Tropicibacter oceani]
MTTSNNKKPPKPKVSRERLKWVWPKNGTDWVPYHRFTWSDSSGKRKEKAVRLQWEGDLRKLDEEYWAAEAGRHPSQVKPTKYTWRECIRLWRSDPKKAKKLKASTRNSYNREFEKILDKNGDKPMPSTSRQAVRRKHASLADTPRAADWMLQTVSLLWNYAKDTLDWPLGDNPAAKIEKFGAQKEFPSWPDWLLNELPNAPDKVHIAGELIRGTGQRPSAAVKTPCSAFEGEWVTVQDEKGGNTFQIYCPGRLRNLIANLPKGNAHVLAKSKTTALSYSAVEKEFRTWRATLTELANAHGDDVMKYSLHGLRKRACVELAEAGCSDSEIQAVTGQSLVTVAKYRKEANRKKLSQTAQTRRAE